MKCICVQRVQLRGEVVAKGAARDLTEAELKEPRLALSFRRAKENEESPAARKTEKPLTGQGGAPLPQNAQMTEAQLKERLTAMGVKFPEAADKPALFALLQDALEPPVTR